MHTIAKQLRIEGRVQGVGFRQFMLHMARDLGITGWVRNRRDGSVEAIIAGTPDKVQMMMDRARRGPSHAAVTGFQVAEMSGEWAQFEMRATE